MPIEPESERFGPRTIATICYLLVLGVGTNFGTPDPALIFSAPESQLLTVANAVRDVPGTIRAAVFCRLEEGQLKRSSFVRSLLRLDATTTKDGRFRR